MGGFPVEHKGNRGEGVGRVRGGEGGGWGGDPQRNQQVNAHAFVKTTLWPPTLDRDENHHRSASYLDNNAEVLSDSLVRHTPTLCCHFDRKAPVCNLFLACIVLERKHSHSIVVILFCAASLR